jgi:hypothetical protein
MRKTRNSAPTNMDSLFDVLPYQETALSTLPKDVQAEIICGCGFIGVRESGVIIDQVETDSTSLDTKDGPSVSLKKRAHYLIDSIFEISNRNMAEGREKKDNKKYGDPTKRYNEADLAAKKYFEKAFGVDELIAGGMSRNYALTMADEAWRDYNKQLGGTGTIAKQRGKFNKIQKNILDLM